MKKAIKDYLAKLHDNKKDKGFSLVELIIVIAIMAILVGVVASQVLPYIEKSRRSKDTEVLGNVASDMVTAVADAMADGSETTKSFTFTVSSAGATSGNTADFGKLVYAKYKDNKLSSAADPLGDVTKDLKSKAGTAGFTVKFDASKNTILVQSSDTDNLIKINSKLQ